MSAKNSLKGYTYQQYVTTLFIAKMDTERSIQSVEAEADVTHNMDDIVIRTDDGDKLYIQVKNYSHITREDIKQIDDFTIQINDKKIKLSETDTNLIIINSDHIPTDDNIFGFACCNLQNAYIIPITPEEIEKIIDSMYSVELRAHKIIELGYEKISNGKFLITQEDLPPLPIYSTDLNERTIYLRSLIEFKKGVICIVGKPGVGKSHFAEELRDSFKNVVLYRMWIGSQDNYIRERRQFKNFLTDLGCQIFGSSRSFTEEELITEINTRSPEIIIDGLDHIENYEGEEELKKFIRFITSISEAKVILLTRPLKTEIPWPIINLPNWTRDESNNYLIEAHGIDHYAIQTEIFEMVAGYPIITSFLAQHYSQKGTINITTKIDDINEYYKQLITNVNVMSGLSLFLISYSYFTRDEINELLTTEHERDVINEFILAYPYLFERKGNRISLIHDSLNTYLLKVHPPRDSFKNAVLSKVKESIREKNIEYLSRFACFDFDTDFKKTVLLEYSDFQTFIELISANYDFESVREFYQALKTSLEFLPGIFDIYQYYSFILISQITERDNMSGNYGLYLILLGYLSRIGVLEKEIFSSGSLWSVYSLVILNDKGDELRKLYSNHSLNQRLEISSYNKDYKKEKTYFDILKEVPNIDEIISDIKQDSSLSNKNDKIIDLFASVYLHNITDFPLYGFIDRYLKKEEDRYESVICYNFCNECGLETGYWTSNILSKMKFRIYSLGGSVDKKNIFRDNSLDEIISKYAYLGSYEVHNYVLSYIRLALYEHREIDIMSIWKYCFMYFNHKDMTTYTLSKALVVFEKYDYIDPFSSIKLITCMANMSDEGRRYYLSSYINNKDESFIHQCIGYGVFDGMYPIDIFDLHPKHINFLGEWRVHNRIQKLFSDRSPYSKYIDFADIHYVLDSKYSDYLISQIKTRQFSVHDVPDEYLSMLKDIDCTSKEKRDKRVPFAYNTATEEDLEYIITSKMPFLDVAGYTDGYFDSFSILKLYQHYQYSELRKSVLDIIHTALFSKINSIDHLSGWSNYLGNIPTFLDMIGYDVAWSRLYELFEQFITISQIHFPAEL
ncbi:MAG: hypothetical protein PHR29_05375 [Acholeplasmataceae bacterium]|jgi:hypothetical protein|nr:hypothetical protein [Acholeplasmataceae bacterium]